MLSAKPLDYFSCFSTFLQHSSDVCLLLNNQSVIQEINPSALYNLQWQKKDILQQPLEEVCKKHHMQPLIYASTPLTLSQKSTTLQHNSGEKKISWKLLPVSHDNEVELLLLIGHVKRISATEELPLLQLENIVKYAPCLVYWKDKNSVYAGCNEEFASLAGVPSRKDIIGKTDFDLIWKERAQLYIDTDQEVIQSGQPRLNHQEQIRISGNRTITVITNKVPLRDHNHNLIGVMGITTDITMQVENANNVPNFTQNIQQDMRSLATNIWAILHDLVKKDQIPDPPLLRLLRDNSKQLLTICHDIVDCDRIERGEIPIVCKHFRIESILKHIIELHQVAALNKGLLLSYTIDKKIPRLLQGDAQRLSKIWMYLIENAIKCTSDRCIQLQVNLYQEAQESYLLQFTLQDTGTGNQNIYRDLSFGFSIVKKYVEYLQGELHIQSIAHKRSALCLHIPFLKALKETENLRVLLIEDKNLDTTLPLLQKLPLAISTAQDVESALQALDNTPFDMVLSNLHLADGTGFEIVRKTKADPYALHQSTPFFALSTNINSHIQAEAKEAGFTYVLETPLCTETLLTYMHQLEIPLPSYGVSQGLRVHLPATEEALFALHQFDLFNEQEGLATCGNSASLVELLQELLRSIPQYKIELYKAHAQQDWEQIEKLAHNYKGGASYLGTPRLRYACQYLEQYHRIGYKLSLEKLFQQVMTVFDKTEIVVKNWLQRNASTKKPLLQN